MLSWKELFQIMGNTDFIFWFYQHKRKFSGYDTFCPIETFYELTEPYTWHATWEDWFKMCNTPTESTDNSNNSSTSTVTLGS